MSDLTISVRRATTGVVKYTANTTTVKAGGVGPAGPPGGQGFVHTQASPATTWTVNHNLGYVPASVTCVTVGGLEVDCAVHHVSENQSVLSFASAFAGSARFL